MLFTSAAFAQQMQMPPQPAPLDSVTTEQFNTFVDVNKQFQAMQEGTQEKIATMLEDQPMTLERFQQIVMSMQNPQSAGQLNMSPEEEQVLTAIQPQLMQLNTTIQQEQIKILQDNGLTPQLFQQIGQAVSQDPELMQKFTAEMGMDQSGNGQ